MHDLLQAIRKKNNEPCTWGDCTELAAIVNCESQKVTVPIVFVYKLKQK